LGRVVVSLFFLSLLARGEPQTAARQGDPSDLPSTERTLLETVKIQPTAAAWERLGLVRHLQNKYAEAIPAFREAVRLDPKLWTSQLFLGIGLYRTNRFADALAALEIADRLAPKVHNGRDELDYWLGAAYIATGHPLRGLQRLESILQRDARNVQALELAVRTYADASAAAWNEVAEKHFESAAGWEIHGHALESDGDRAGALEAFRRSTELNPKRAGPGFAIGRLLLTEGKAKEALAVLEREAGLGGADPEVYFYAGLAATQLERFAEAAGWLERAMNWPDRNPDAAVALAQVYLSVRDGEQAVRAAQRAVEMNPSSAAAHEILLAALTQTGRVEESAAERRRWEQRAK
jgi:tetratricopeptide (TPR) repeat protein